MKYPLTKFAQKCSEGWIDRCPQIDAGIGLLSSPVASKVFRSFIFCAVYFLLANEKSPFCFLTLNFPK